MPIHLTAQHRRQFLFATGAALVCSSAAWGRDASDVEDDLVYLFKAYVHGHIHDRSTAQHQGIHIINTPATSYVADPAKSTTGWTTARLNADRIELTTHTTDPQHPWNGETETLSWRQATR